MLVNHSSVCLPLQAGKVRKHVSEKERAEEGLGPNIKSIVTMLMLMLLMMFAVHCTWVTSNAYSSPSVVLASYNHDGYGLHHGRALSLVRSWMLNNSTGEAKSAALREQLSSFFLPSSEHRSAQERGSAYFMSVAEVSKTDDCRSPKYQWISSECSRSWNHPLEALLSR